MKICNKDCFNCPFEDYINDKMDYEDYVESANRDKDLRSTSKSRKLAAQKKAYYEANRDKLAEYQKAYREANRDKIAEYQKAYYEANKIRIAENRRKRKEG